MPEDAPTSLGRLHAAPGRHHPQVLAGNFTVTHRILSQSWPRCGRVEVLAHESGGGGKVLLESKPSAPTTTAHAAPISGHGLRRNLLEIGGVAAAYFVGAKLGLHLAFLNKNVTAVWPPTGVAVASLLLLGVRIWPGIALGALTSNLTNGAGVDTSLLITVGNTLAPVVAWLLGRQVVRVQPRLERLTDVVGTLFLGGPLAMTVSATLGTAALAATGSLHWSAYGTTWLTWWVGDAMGVVIVTPLVLVVATRCWRSVRLDGWHRLEAAALVISITGVSLVTFAHAPPLSFLVLPLATWGAVRFFQLGAAVAVAIVAMVSITDTVNGHGPFVHGLSITGSLITLQAFNGALAFTTLLLAAASLQHHRAQVALRADAAELEELLRQERQAAFGEMTAVVSHDLRNPLAAITNSHYLLRETLGASLDGDAALYLDLAERETARAVTLTSQILEYRRPRRLELTEIDLKELIDRAIVTTPPPVNVDLAVECTDARVRVDPDQMLQVLTNLVTNAYDAMDDSGSLELTGSVEGDMVVVTASDTGPGFEESEQERVFEPFFSTKPSGTGLGLAIVRRIVESHGGRVTIENRPTGGALVTVLLSRGIKKDLF